MFKKFDHPDDNILFIAILEKFSKPNKRFMPSHILHTSVYTNTSIVSINMFVQTALIHSKRNKFHMHEVHTHIGWRITQTMRRLS